MKTITKWEADDIKAGTRFWQSGQERLIVADVLGTNDKPFRVLDVKTAVMIDHNSGRNAMELANVMTLAEASPTEIRA